MVFYTAATLLAFCEGSFYGGAAERVARRQRRGCWGGVGEGLSLTPPSAEGQRELFICINVIFSPAATRVEDCQLPNRESRTQLSLILSVGLLSANRDQKCTAVFFCCEGEKRRIIARRRWWIIFY